MHMPDYKEMYLTMMRATERAIRILIDAQQQCEELYINASEPELIVLENTLTQQRESDIV